MMNSTFFSGMITLPFNMVSNTPVECTINPNQLSNKNLTLLDSSAVSFIYSIEYVNTFI